MTSKFLLNNFLTYNDQRLKGLSLLTGWLTFSAACGLGGAANVGVASWMYQNDNHWILSSLVGIMIGTVWNYFATSIVTRRGHRA